MTIDPNAATEALAEWLGRMHVRGLGWDHENRETQEMWRNSLRGIARSCVALGEPILREQLAQEIEARTETDIERSDESSNDYDRHEEKVARDIAAWAAAIVRGAAS